VAPPTITIIKSEISYFTAGDATQLAQRLQRLIEDPSLGKDLATGAAQTYARRFSPERFSRELGIAYQFALAKFNDKKGVTSS
jgi:hypothetical protein